MTNNTSAVGMIIDRVASDRLPSRIISTTPTARPTRSLVKPEEREARLRQKCATLWITGLHASGKKQ